ncbi:tetratricopeptide repeat protein [Sulfurimonas sp.]
MLKWILFALLPFNLLALEISLSSAKENFQQYSTLHLKDTKPFLCQEMKNDFKEVTQIVCAFNKKPSSKVKELQNSFFKIENTTKNKTFFLIITPFQKIKQYPMVFDMTKDTTVYQANAKLSEHWMIVGYKDKLPFIKEEKQTDISINFPFELSSDMLPYVGGLDIEGKPVHIKRVGDVTDYLKIKELYKEEKYDRCLELIDEVMTSYPNSLFNAELIYYKIISYAKLDDNDNVISLSKEYLREYSSDENVPEVLSLIARAYSLIGMHTDAEYFFDRLFSEHENTMFAKWGYIYMGQMLESGGGASKAIKLYKKALMETKEIDIAVTAAYRLANYNLSVGKREEAAKYIMQIVNAKSDYFMIDLSTSMDMMYQFADEGDYITASEIAKSIVDATDNNHDEYERLLKDRGMWLSKTDEKEKALAALNDYLRVFEDGIYSEIIDVAKDELFFDTNDANFTVRLNEYNNLIDDYNGDTIGNRAIYEKAKLLLKNEMYGDVLSFKDSLLELDTDTYKDIDNIIEESAIGVMKLSLKNRECEEVLNISTDYNITLSSEWDDGVYECSMMGGDYLLSKRITGRNLNSKDLLERKKWLYRHIKVDFATGNYSEVIGASKELITLIEDDKESEYKDIYRILFDTYHRLEENDKLLDTIVKIQNIFGRSYKDIERYIAVMTMGSNKKDDNIVIKYGEDVVNIQNSSSSYAQSPFVEFSLYQSYINTQELNKALKIIKSLDSLELDKKTRARQKYLLGTVLSKLWRDEESQAAYQESIDADASSPWAKLAKSAKEI